MLLLPALFCAFTAEKQTMRQIQGIIFFIFYF